MPTTVITTEHLDIGYPKHPIVQDFNTEIRSGEFIAVLGPNGAGKTTLLKTLLGSLKPLKGTLKVLNHTPHQDCISIGYLPQQLLRAELQHLTAYTLLEAAIQAHQWGLPHLSKPQKEEIHLAFQHVDALPLMHKTFGLCSGGEQRRIMLAQALLGQPKILLLDEPLANLDFHHQEKFIDILTRLSRQQQVTILMTTHDINPITQTIDRVLYLAKGRALLGSVAEILTSAKLSELYQIPIEVVQHHQRYFVVHRETGHIENVCCEHV